MAYAIMRCKKLKSMGSVGGSLRHAFRERDTHNADPARRSHNQTAPLGGVHVDSTDAAMGRLRERLPGKTRKNAVLTVEYLMSASPEWWATATPDQQGEFFRRSLHWLREKYGENNVLAAVIHNDETTPHLSAFVVPITRDGRLSASELIGNRARMSTDQTSYAACVADLGLQRGIERSGARHTTIREWYAGQTDLDTRAKTLSEREHGVFEREHGVGKGEAVIAAQRAALADWEARRDAWLDRNRPTPASPAERVSLRLAAMPDAQRTEAMRVLWRQDRAAAEAVDAVGWVTYEDGSVTPAGRQALSESAEWADAGLDLPTTSTPGPSGP